MRHLETEVKIKIADLKATRNRLKKLGLRLVHRRALEDNILLDTPDRSLRKIRSVLRLRQYGSRWVITFKGTPADDPLYKSRLELETELSEPQTIRSILEVLGFGPAFRYQKYRTQYAPAGSARTGKIRRDVSLDETPIGNFLEIEGSRDWIDRTARRLGYSLSDYSTASYGALYLEECRKNNVQPGDMIFRSSTSTRKPPL